MTTVLAFKERRMSEPAPEPGDGRDERTEETGRRELALLDELKRGSREAAEKLVDATYPRVYAALVKLTGDPDQAADLTQETYRKAWKSLAEFREAAQVSTWLYRIAYNTFLNTRRRPMRIVPLEPEVEATAIDTGPPPDVSAAEAERAGRLREAVLALPEELRFPVTAHYWSELPVSELAEILNLTPQAVRKRLRRAHEALASTLAALEESR
jgi:RNA polymerase sigma-70 factor (ECF subfamily)